MFVSWTPGLVHNISQRKYRRFEVERIKEGKTWIVIAIDLTDTKCDLDITDIQIPVNNDVDFVGMKMGVKIGF